MLSVRKEHDSLGEIEVAATALYGAQTQRALQNFKISGRVAHPELIRAYLRIKKSAALANFSCGVLPRSQCDLIVASVEELLKRESEWPQIFPVDPYQAGAGTSQNMNLNEVIANVANLKEGAALGTYKPIHPNDQVNRSQSTNDTFPTAMRLAILEASRSLALELESLSLAFLKKSEEFKDIPKSARTHLQDAVPIRLGQEFRAYSATLKTCADWIQYARTFLKKLGIGGSAAGTGLTVPEGFAASMIQSLSHECSEKLEASTDLIESMQSQAPIGLYSSMLRLSALELTRICNDLRLLASGPMTGLSELILPSVQPGSSIMPGKVNPSIVEMANQTWFSVLGYDQSLAFALQAGQLELNVMMPIMAYSALESTRVATEALKTLRLSCIEGLDANRERCQRYFESTPQIATALSPKLGYEKTAELVKEALAQEKTILELAREKKLLSEKELRELIDIHRLTGR